MTDCEFETIDGWCVCKHCGTRVKFGSCEKLKSNCLRSVNSTIETPDINVYSVNENNQKPNVTREEVEQKLAEADIPLNVLSTYRIAVLNWAKAGFPVRTKEQVKDIADNHCNASKCNKYKDGRCTGCGCLVNQSNFALFNKAKMATEHCPDKRW
jgi:hypothetical protein